MIIALLALALAMIVGGLLTSFFGWDIVLVERGWTMVIAGSVMAAGGAVLLGIAAAVAKLSGIHTLLSQMQESAAQEDLAAAPQSHSGLSLAAASGGVIAAAAAADTDEAESKEPAEAAQSVLPLFPGEERRDPDADEVQVAAWPAEPPADELRPEEPILPFPPRATPPSAPLDEDEMDMKVPDFLLAERDRDFDEEPRVIDGGDIGLRDHDDARAPQEEERDERDRLPEPALEIEPEREPEPDLAPEPVRPDLEEELDQEAVEVPDKEHGPDPSEPATVVGTYNSGDNKYVMFSDGSIEAQTPSGTFRFKSLDELKEFIAAGGEGDLSSSI
jgi:hypothetical protein